MMTRCLALLLVFLSAGAAAAQDESIRGDHERIAACVYRALDDEAPGNFRYVDLRAEDTIIITMDLNAGAGYLRSMKAVFTKAAPGYTSIEVDGRAPGYYPKKVRPLAEDCSAKLTQRAGKKAR